MPCSSVRTTTARGPLWQSHGSFHSPARNHSGAFPKCILASFRRPLPACPPTARTTSKPRDDAKTRLDPGLTLATLCDLGFGALGWRWDPCACLFLPRLRAAWGSLSFHVCTFVLWGSFCGGPDLLLYPWYSTRIIRLFCSLFRYVVVYYVVHRFRSLACGTLHRSSATNIFSLRDSSSIALVLRAKVYNTCQIQFSFPFEVPKKRETNHNVHIRQA